MVGLVEVLNHGQFVNTWVKICVEFNGLSEVIKKKKAVMLAK